MTPILAVPHVGGKVGSDSVSLGVDDPRAAQTLRHVLRPLDSSRIMRIRLRLLTTGFGNWIRLHWPDLLGTERQDGFVRDGVGRVGQRRPNVVCDQPGICVQEIFE